MEFEINGKTYRASKINALAQFHIVRRLAAVLGAMAPHIKTGGAEAIPALTEALAKLSDTDADYCLFGLLKAVSRKESQGLGWSPVSVETSLMYDDITMPIMLQLAHKAFMENFAGFFAALPSVSTDPVLKQGAPVAG